MTGDSVVLQSTWLRIMWKTAVRNAHPAMTMVWQLSAAEECMDGMLLLIKEIFPPHLLIFHRFSVAPINPLWFKCWDLALNTRAGMLDTLSNMRKLPHTDEKASLKYIPLSETGPPTHVLFWKWYKRPCVQLRSETSRSLQPQAVLENC